MVERSKIGAQQAANQCHQEITRVADAMFLLAAVTLAEVLAEFH